MEMLFRDLYLGPASNFCSRLPEAAFIFWGSLHDEPIYLRLHPQREVRLLQHYATGERSDASDVNQADWGELVEAMQEARAAFLLMMPLAVLDLRGRDGLDCVLGRFRLSGGGAGVRDSSPAQAVYRAVKDGDLVFLPGPQALRDCVQAVRRRWASAQRDAAPRQPTIAEQAEPLYGNRPRMPSGLGDPTPLGDAQAFDYRPDLPDGDVLELAGGEGTPGNNQAQNTQFKAVVKALGLNKDQARQLHDDISKQGLGYHEMLERGQDLFGGGDD
ncbi:hypothetical protein EHZ19_05095 [Paraburkholderia bannensis]|nr:hypothetical protein [Paraburkholderia bannensis]RQM49772.1 hypothetical protein EHZ19_05095 [Paraburkholderia bannensis]